MSRNEENAGFKCVNCGINVLPLTNGSYRNHCPNCLHSLHVDIKPGDRLNMCKGIMKPMGVKYSSKKGYQIIHKCKKCGKQSINKIAENDDQSDDLDEIIKIMKI